MGSDKESVNEWDLLAGNRDRLFRIAPSILFSAGAGDIRNVAIQHEYGYVDLLFLSACTFAPAANNRFFYHHNLAYA